MISDVPRGRGGYGKGIFPLFKEGVWWTSPKKFYQLTKINDGFPVHFSIDLSTDFNY